MTGRQIIQGLQLAVLGAGLFSQCFAQNSESSFRGKLLDPARSPIVGARIVAANTTTAATFSAASNSNGEFSLMLPSGDYHFNIMADGFAEFAQAISFRDGASAAPHEFVLEVATFHTSVTVVEGVGYVTTSISTATRTLTPLRDVPQSITVISKELIRDQMMSSVGDVMR